MNKLWEQIKNLIRDQWQIQVIKRRMISIRKISNPSEKVQTIAVEKNPDALKYIENPSKETQRIAKELSNEMNGKESQLDKIGRGKSENDLGVQMNKLYNQAGDNEQRKEKIIEAYRNIRENLRSYNYGTELGDSFRISSPEERIKPNPTRLTDIKLEAIQILQGNSPERIFDQRFTEIRNQFVERAESLSESINDIETGKTYKNIRMMSDNNFHKKNIYSFAKSLSDEIKESIHPTDLSKYADDLIKADNLEIGKVPTIEEALSLFSHKYLLPKEINSAVFENEESGKYEITRPNIQYDVFDNRNTQLMKAGTNPYSPNYKELFDNLGLKKEFNEFEKKCVERDSWNGSYFYAVAAHDIAEIYDLDRELPMLDQNIEDSRKILYEGMIQKINTEKKIAIDKQTVEIFCIPDTIKKIKIAEEDKEKLARGEKVLIKGMISSKGTPFDAYVHVNKEKNTLAFDLPRKKEKIKMELNNPQTKSIAKPKKRKLGS